MSPDHANLLRGLIGLPHESRIDVLRKTGDAADLLSDLLDLTESIAKNTREFVEDFLVTEQGMRLEEAKEINLPTLAGALNGIRLADAVNPKPCCHGCAFRLGTPANQSDITTSDAEYALDDGRDFLCHLRVDESNKPYQVCAGFAQKKQLREAQDGQ